MLLSEFPDGCKKMEIDNQKWREGIALRHPEMEKERFLIEVRRIRKLSYVCPFFYECPQKNLCEKRILSFLET